MKKIKYLLIVFLLLIRINCNATTKTFDRNELENYGVKKDWNITEQNKDNVLKTKAVDASEKIYDYAELLTEEEEKVLKESIDEFIETNKMDLVIVTDSFSYIQDTENEDYAADFYDYNDFGMQFENNSGILLLRNSNPSDPYYDMYTFGNAQLYFNQQRYDSILDGIYNDLHAGNYLIGMKDFISRTDSYIKQGIPSEMKNYYVDEKGYLKQNYHIPWTISIIISLVLTTIIMVIMIGKNKMVKKAITAEEYVNKNSINISKKEDKLINTHTTHYRISSDSGGGGFSSHSHSGSSGGGHSSGGGRHG